MHPITPFSNSHGVWTNLRALWLIPWVAWYLPPAQLEMKQIQAVLFASFGMSLFPSSLLFWRGLCGRKRLSHRLVGKLEFYNLGESSHTPTFEQSPLLNLSSIQTRDFMILNPLHYWPLGPCVHSSLPRPHLWYSLDILFLSCLQFLRYCDLWQPV